MGDNDQKSNKSFTYEDKPSKNEEILEDKKENDKKNKVENQKMIDDYIIKNTIGKGTFSTVKLGENIKTKQKVAIKILNKEKIKAKEDLDRINREIKILQMMDHPNIIKTYKISQNTKNFFIIMEYCDGGELFNYIVEKEKLDENEASMFFYQLISALEYIHSLGITHRDLKPENLLLVKNKIIKIIDFGLSNYFNGEKQLETPCGSPSYASPEIIKGEAYNGFNIDIWASGIILFAMLCGYLPFDDDEEEEDDDEEDHSYGGNINRKSSKDVSSDESEDNEVLFQRILEGKLEYPSHLSKDAVDLMKKILVVDPNKRIQIKDIKKHKFFLLGQKNYLLNQKNILQHQTSEDENTKDKNMTNNMDNNENKENSVNNSLPSEDKNSSKIKDEEFKDYNSKINKINIKKKEELKNEMEEYEKKLFDNYLRKVNDFKKNNPFLKNKNKQNNRRNDDTKKNIYSNELNTINVHPMTSSINRNIEKYGRKNNNYTLNKIIMNFGPNYTKRYRQLDSPSSLRYHSNDIKYIIPMTKISPMIKKRKDYPINLNNNNIFIQNENSQNFNKNITNLYTINIPEITPKRKNHTDNKLLNSVKYYITNGNYNRMNEINKNYIYFKSPKKNYINHFHDINRRRINKPILPIIKTSLFSLISNNGINHNKDFSILSPDYHLRTEATNEDARKRMLYIGNRNAFNGFNKSNKSINNDLRNKLFYPNIKKINISKLKGIY
mgnify:CR=1 FL=1